MWIHFLLFVVLLVIILINRGTQQKSKGIIICAFLIFFCFSAFRAYDVGNDTYEYHRIFVRICACTSLREALSSTRFEFGYALLNYVVSRFTKNYTILLLLINAFYYWSSFNLIKKYGKDMGRIILLFFSLQLAYDPLVIQRQCIAMAFFYFAIPALIKRKKLQYCLLILLACLFHISSIILFALVFITNYDFSDRRIVRIWTGSLFIGLMLIWCAVPFVLKLFPYFEHYFYKSAYTGSVRAASIALFSTRLLPFVAMKLFFPSFYLGKMTKVDGLFHKLALLDLMIIILSIGFNLFDRFESFFTLSYALFLDRNLFYYPENDFRDKNTKLMLKLFFICIFFFYITTVVIWRSNWLGIFPYSFV